MVEETRSRFSEHILEEALRRAEVSREDCTELGGFESFVYRLPDQILKITHTARRSADYLMGEVEFIEHLAQRGMALPRPIAFSSGAYVESIPDDAGGFFLAYRFEEGQGQPTTFADWDEAFIEEWGAVSGQINQLGRDFSPSRPEHMRVQWFADPLLELDRHFPADQQDAAARGLALIRRLRDLPRDPRHYGMTHGDLHQHNFFKGDDGRLVPFDFDDCEVAFDENDIAIPLFYAVSAVPDAQGAPTRSAFAEFFLVHFVRGFLTTCPLTRAQLNRIPDLLMLRNVILMAVIYGNDFSEPERPRVAESLRRFHRCLDGGEPVVALNIEKLARQLLPG
ncbi:MAG: phosphotransferase [Myxococcota bacterium]